MAPKAKEKQPKTPPPVVSIEDLFTSLNRHIERVEYEQAVKVSDQGLPFFPFHFMFLSYFLSQLLTYFPIVFAVLAISPGDEDAVQCKIVALIRADNIDDALKAIDSFKKLPIDLNFFKVWKFISLRISVSFLF